jgi:TPR repeat protein
MRLHRLLSPMLALLATLALAATGSVTEAAEVRGVVTRVEARAHLQIAVPKGAEIRPGDEVRCEIVVPGVGAFQTSARWRVTLVGEDVVIAEPQGAVHGTPKAGDTAIVVSRAAAARPAVAEAARTGFRLPSAEQWAALNKGAADGVPSAMYLLSRMYAHAFDTISHFEAARWLRLAAANNHRLAMVELADRYFTGKDVRQDFAVAAQWYGRAAELGYKPAMLRMAALHAEGKGVRKDLAESFRWSLKAAEAGEPTAMLVVASRYRRGEGVATDLAEAKRWYEAAAAKGEAEAMYGLSVLYLFVARDPERAADWMMRAIGAGSLNAAEQLMDNPWEWSSDFRKALQTRLHQAGVYSGAIDGGMGRETRQAIADLARALH